MITDRGRYTTSPQLVHAGTDPTFHCYASGWPRPTVTWLRNSSEIRNGDNEQSYKLNRREDGVDLTILSVSQKEHAGLYTCLAENKMGRLQHAIIVQVMSEYNFENLEYQESSSLLYTPRSYPNRIMCILYLSLFVCLFVCPCLLACLSVYLPVYLSVCMSVQRTTFH